MPFDQYQRYRLVADLVDDLRAGERLRILDVGGRTGLLRRFLPEDSITLVDLEPSGQPGLVLGNGSRLPFRRAFDVVTACDTLEHVRPAQRDHFVRECFRVSRRWVILAGPYKQRRVVGAERLLRRFLREKLGTRHRYLEEHALHGLPDPRRVRAVLRESGARSVATIGHGNVERWLALMMLSMYMDRDPPLRRFARLFYRFYNEALYDSDGSPPVYRHAIVACAEKTRLPAQDELFPARHSLDEAFEPFTGLIQELLAFDRERDVYDAERNRLLQVNEGLLRDLEGHRTERGWFERELRARRLEQERLERERDLHSAERERLEVELQRLEEELERVNRIATSLNEQLGAMSLDLNDLNLDAVALEHLQLQLRQPKRALKHFLRTTRDKYLGRSRRSEPIWAPRGEPSPDDPEVTPDWDESGA